jgi:hypothetical protein
MEILINISFGTIGIILMLMALYVLGLIYQLKFLFKSNSKYKYSFNLSYSIIEGAILCFCLMLISLLLLMLYRFGDIIINYKHYWHIIN